MNVVNLAGNPTADPVESTYTYKDKDGNEKNGRRASFVLAVSVSNGRRYEEATFVRCVAFNNNAKIVFNRVKCGKKIIVQGHLKSGIFERDGVKQYTLDLIVDCIEFCQKATEEKENTEFVEMSENAGTGREWFTNALLTRKENYGQEHNHILSSTSWNFG